MTAPVDMILVATDVATFREAKTPAEKLDAWLTGARRSPAHQVALHRLICEELVAVVADPSLIERFRQLPVLVTAKK